MRAAIYTRISDARDQDTAGVRRQEQDCRKLVTERGWELVDVYVDNNRSATSGVRPEYRRLLEDVRSNEVDVVVVWATDRLYRRISDLEELVAVLGPIPVETVKGGQINLSTADGKTVARILGSVAQGEVEKRGERVSRAAQQRAEAGRFGGGTRRFGYDKTMKDLVPAEAEAIEWATLRLLDGGSLREVVREWTSRGLTGPSGAALTPNAVKGILLRPVNAGLATYKGEIVGKSLAPVIVEETQFRQLRALLTDPRRRTSPEGDHRTLLSGILVCGVCGGPVRAHTRMRAAGDTPRLAYGCVPHRHVTRARGKLDEAISDLVLAYLVKHRATIRRAPKVASQTAQKAVTEAEVIRAKLDQLAALMAAGDLDTADYASATRGLRDRLADTETRIARHAGTPSTSRLLAEEDLKTTWESASTRTKRAIIRELIHSITIPVGTPGRFTMDGVTVAWRVGDSVLTA